tara:strand:+ start:3124 stop:3426 length:303 start_codon:yes stop_codon:yes gene_type:complete
MHSNSLASYYEGNTSAFTRRETEILGALQRLGSATDRAIRDALGFPDMNAVRPRITELIVSGVLTERGSTLDPITNRTVRVVAVAFPGNVQTELELGGAA